MSEPHERERLAGAAPREMDRWMHTQAPDGKAMIVVVVDDADDDELVRVVADEDQFPSEHFGGVWGAGERDGYWLVGFVLVELGGCIERQWFTDNIHRELLEAILDIPHIVAVMPREIAGDANNAEGIVARLGGSLLVEVQRHSAQVETILLNRSDD